ncbi:MAG: hypothetical protein FJZ01_10195 [Candidatus Sericytochromatia bacterium]|nr:hypothetical protein [Candidatus Tanganyikabacteria bacterium]
MAHSRSLLPRDALTGSQLTAALAGIGIGFAAVPDLSANIEDVLFFASVEAVDREDFRVLSTLVSWFDVHHPWVNADRLIRVVEALGSERVKALWAALATWHDEDRRFARLMAASREPRIDLLGVGTDFQIARHGEDPRFCNSPIRIPPNVLRSRPEDILSPSELAARHPGYRWRVVIGPTYRADAWAELSQNPDLPAAELARRAYASFATAWLVRRDFQIVRQSSRSDGQSATA